MQCSLYDLANVVPTLAKFYHQASESYELACTRHISSLIYLVCKSTQKSTCCGYNVFAPDKCKIIFWTFWQQFERLFQFNRKVEELTYTIAAEEVS